jgi:Spy/CpxP family protein refolding chaperone
VIDLLINLGAIIMFKILQLCRSKLFQYGAITAIILSSGALIASSATNHQDADQDNLENAITKTASVGLSAMSIENDWHHLAQSATVDNPNALGSGRILRQLNLSTVQLQKIREISDRDRDSMRALAKELKQGHQELRQLLASDENSNTIRAKHQGLQVKQMQLRQLTFERMLAMREVLSPEQRSQLNEIVQKNRRPRELMRDRLENRPLRRSPATSS